MPDLGISVAEDIRMKDGLAGAPPPKSKGESGEKVANDERVAGEVTTKLFESVQLFARPPVLRFRTS